MDEEKDKKHPYDRAAHDQAMLDHIATMPEEYQNIEYLFALLFGTETAKEKHFPPKTKFLPEGSEAEKKGLYELAEYLRGDQILPHVLHELADLFDPNLPASKQPRRLQFVPRSQGVGKGGLYRTETSDMLLFRHVEKIKADHGMSSEKAFSEVADFFGVEPEYIRKVYYQAKARIP